MDWKQKLEAFEKGKSTYILYNGDIIEAMMFPITMADEHVQTPVYLKDEEYGGGFYTPDHYDDTYYWIHPETHEKHELHPGDYLIADDKAYHVCQLPRGAIHVWKECPVYPKYTYFVLHATDRANEWEEFDDPKKMLSFVQKIGKGRIRLVIAEME